MVELRPGEIISGRYEILAQIGEGAFAQVFRGRDHNLNREIAIKVMRSSSNVSDVERFHREAKLLGQLVHKNIVSVYAYELLDGSTPYITMEFLQGENLQSLLLRSQTLSLDLVTAILRQCCEALIYAHNAGIVHRDLSPSNIFLLNTSNAAELKILDFGLSKLCYGDKGKTLTETGMLVGNPSYMSPELARGDQVDLRSDIYALGCILYECLAGEKPFVADTGLGIIYLQQNENPKQPNMRHENHDMESALQMISLCCLQKDPARRFQSCQEILNCLSELELNKDVFSKLEPWSHTRIRPSGSYQLRAPAIGIATVIVLFGLLLFAGDISLALIVTFLSAIPNSSVEQIELDLANQLEKSKKTTFAGRLYAHLCAVNANNSDRLKIARLLLKKMQLSQKTSLITNAALNGSTREQFADLKKFAEVLSLEKDSKDRAALLTNAYQFLEDKEQNPTSTNEVVSLKNKLLAQMLRSRFQSKSDLRRCVKNFLKSRQVIENMSVANLKSTQKNVITAVSIMPDLVDASYEEMITLRDECGIKGLQNEMEELTRAIYRFTNENRINATVLLAEELLEDHRPQECIDLIRRLGPIEDGEPFKATFLSLEAKSYFQLHNYSESLRLCRKGLPLVSGYKMSNKLRAELMSMEINNLYALRRTQECHYKSKILADELLTSMTNLDSTSETGAVDMIENSFSGISPQQVYLRSWLTGLECFVATKQVDEANLLLKNMLEQIKTNHWRLDHQLSSFFSMRVEGLYSKSLEGVPGGKSCLELMKQVLQEGRA